MNEKHDPSPYTHVEGSEEAAHLVDCLFDLSKHVDEQRTARMLRKAGETIAALIGHQPGTGVKAWDCHYPEPISKGEERVYEGRKFVARQDIKAGSHTNSPSYSGLWKEVE